MKLAQTFAALMFTATVLPLYARIDDDGDGLSDIWERRYGFPVSATPNPQGKGPNDDPDNDGFPNRLEAETGHDPNDSASFFSVHISRRYLDGLQYKWDSLPGVTYVVNSSSDLQIYSPIRWVVPTSDKATIERSFTAQREFVSIERNPRYLAKDSDSDGLEDWEEQFLETSINKRDTDSDGLPDLWEYRNGLDPRTKDSSTDTDGDGWTALIEFLCNSNPNVAGDVTDTDGDTVPDVIERSLGSDPARQDTDSDGISDAHEDSDYDGIDNSTEIYLLGTDPINFDTDGDNLPDSWEVENNLDPNNSNADSDADSDGLADVREFQRKSKPNLVDTDGDGTTDFDEVGGGSDPTNPQDSESDTEEIRKGFTSIPLNWITASMNSGPDLIRFTFTGVSGDDSTLVTQTRNPTSLSVWPLNHPYSPSLRKGAIYDVDLDYQTQNGDALPFFCNGYCSIFGEVIDSTNNFSLAFTGVPAESNQWGSYSSLYGVYTETSGTPGAKTYRLYTPSISPIQIIPTGEIIVVRPQSQGGPLSLPTAGNQVDLGEAIEYHDSPDWAPLISADILEVYVYETDENGNGLNYLPTSDSVIAHDLLTTPLAPGHQLRAIISLKEEILNSSNFYANGDPSNWIFNQYYPFDDKAIASEILITDFDRDGKIDAHDKGIVNDARPWRFWINSDDDAGDQKNAGDSGQDNPYAEEPDWDNQSVDGVRDLVDLFPVQIDLQNYLASLSPEDYANIRVLLKQPESALNFVITDLDPSNVASIHNSVAAFNLGDAESIPLDATGYELPREFLHRIKSNGGVILVEGRPTGLPIGTLTPLILEIERNGELDFTSSMPVSLSPVDDMIRVVNLIGADSIFGTDPQLGFTKWSSETLSNSYPRNMPEDHFQIISPTPKTLISIHGFDWSESEAPAGHAEIFKRFFQAGSNASFVGVTWFSDEAWSGSLPDYNQNVVNAFVSAYHLKRALSEGVNGHVSIFAHSLGNIVASSLICDQGFEADHYFMVNGAVPREAFASETAFDAPSHDQERLQMTNPNWRNVGATGGHYDERLFAANWHRLFPSGDRRSELRWKGRFYSLTSRTNVTNFYSDGEDVLRNYMMDVVDVAGLTSPPGPSASAFFKLTSIVANQKEFVWATNELTKGTWLSSLTLDLHGGWGINGWVDETTRLPANAANALLQNPSTLIQSPFFSAFDDSDSAFPTWNDAAWLRGDTLTANGRLPSLSYPSGTDSLKNHAKILAEAIPAQSYAVGANAMVGTSGPVLNRNMQTDPDIRNGSLWPNRSTKSGRWLHGDYLDPAYCYVSGLYKSCVEQGRLNE